MCTHIHTYSKTNTLCHSKVWCEAVQWLTNSDCKKEHHWHTIIRVCHMLTLSRSLTHTRTVGHTKLSIHSFVYWIHYILNASIRFKASHQLFFLCTVMRTLAVCPWLYSLPHWTNVCHADRGIKHKTCHKPDSERWRKNLATGVLPEALLNWSGERTHDEIRDGWICGPSHYCTYCCKSVSPLSMQPARKHYNFKSIY